MPKEDEMTDIIAEYAAERDTATIVADGERFAEILASLRPDFDALTAHLQSMMDRTFALAPGCDGSVEAYRLHTDFPLMPPRQTTSDACQGFVTIPKLNPVLTRLGDATCFGRHSDYRNQPIITITPLTPQVVATEYGLHHKRRLRHLGVALTQARLGFAAKPYSVKIHEM